MTVTNGLRTKFREMMKGFQVLWECILAEHREGLKRRYFNATGVVATEEVVDEMLSGGSQVRLLDNNGLADFEGLERQRAVNDIQRSLVQLHRVFLDMALMVEEQGNQLDNIEANVARAKDYISSGTDRLAAADANRTRGRIVNCLIWSLVLVVVVVCFILILTGA